MDGGAVDPPQCGRGGRSLSGGDLGAVADERNPVPATRGRRRTASGVVLFLGLVPGCRGRCLANAADRRVWRQRANCRRYDPRRPGVGDGSKGARGFSPCFRGSLCNGRFARPWNPICSAWERCSGWRSWGRTRGESSRISSKPWRARTLGLGSLRARVWRGCVRRTHRPGWNVSGRWTGDRGRRGFSAISSRGGIRPGTVMTTVIAGLA